MGNKSANKNYLDYLLRPWVIETIAFFLVLWQESFRLSSRTLHHVLPIGRQIQNYYYYYFGDFVNGYILAFIADGVINFMFFKTNTYYTIFGFRITERKNALLAVLFSICVVVVFELSQSTSTTSDFKDIPAGILGSLTFYCIRLIALKTNQ